MPTTSSPSNADHEVQLSNGLVVAVVAPAKARIVSFGRPDGPNILWTNPHPVATSKGINHGGDRVLFSPQGLWPQIRPGGVPDPTAINTPWRIIEQSAQRLVLQSEPDEGLGVRMTRTITLPDGQPELHQSYRLERTTSNPFPVHVWTIAQVPAIGSVWMNVAEDSPDLPNAAFTDLIRNLDPDSAVKYWPDQQALRFQWPDDRSSKIGTFGTWLAWVNEGEGLLITAPRFTPGPYIDRSNLQVFVFSGPNAFIELETQSPTAWLPPHGNIEHQVRWRLLHWDKAPDEENLVRQLSSLADVPADADTWKR